MANFKTISILILMAVLLTGCGESNTVPTLATAVAATPVISPVTTKRTTVTRTELNYPGARWLSDKDIWPTGRPNYIQGDLFGIFVTNDNQQQVLDFYHRRLISLGLGYGPSYNCSDPSSCRQIYQLDADITECTPERKFCVDTYSIQFVLVNSGAGHKDDSSGNIPETIYSLVKPSQTLVVFRGGPNLPMPTPPAKTTTAAFVTPIALP